MQLLITKSLKKHSRICILMKMNLGLLLVQVGLLLHPGLVVHLGLVLVSVRLSELV